MSAWKWSDKVEGKCAGCTGPLREFRNSLIEWRGKVWHSHCLIDHLTQIAPPEAPSFPEMWAGLGPGASP